MFAGSLWQTTGAGAGPAFSINAERDLPAEEAAQRNANCSKLGQLQGLLCL